MNVTASEEYGLRCAVRLASLSGDETLSASQIAESEGLSVEYVSKFMLHLRRAGIVRTVRGAHGGFALNKPANQISLKEVFDALSGKKKVGEDFCEGFSGREKSCVRISGCSIRPFWKVMSYYVEQFTSELKLSDMLQDESKTLLKTQGIAQRNTSEWKNNLGNA